MRDDFDEATYQEQKAWEEEQEDLASESAKAENEAKIAYEEATMMTPEEQRKQVKTEIQEVFRQAYWFARQHPKQSEAIDLNKLTDQLADKILSIKGIHIEHPDQKLPPLPNYAMTESIGGSVLSEHSYKEAQQDMLKAGWVKYLPIDKAIDKPLDNNGTRGK